MSTPEWERDAYEYERDWWKSLSDEEKEEMQAEADEAFSKLVFDPPAEQMNHPNDCSCGSPLCSSYNLDETLPF